MTLSAGGVTLTFDKASGYMTQYMLNGENLLLSAPKPNFWRAATDNDRAWGMGNRMRVWKEATEQQQLLDFKVEKGKGVITVKTTHKLAKTGTLVSLNYSLVADGSLKVAYHLKPEAGMPDMPRVGLQLQIPSRYDQLAYFGRGPWETYADKKTGAFFGRYESSVKDDYVYYVRPQESSNKMDVYWAALTDDSGKGIRIDVMGLPLNVSAWPFSQAQIEQANRIEDLSFGEALTLNIDHLQMGVGGDNTWNLDAQPHEPFRIPARAYQYAFTIKPLK